MGLWYFRRLSRQKARLPRCDESLKASDERETAHPWKIQMSSRSEAGVTSKPVTCPHRGFPLVHPIVCRACLLMRARTSPPSLPEMPCAPVCSPWTEPLPESRWQGATSGRPGRCSPRTHLWPGSQRSTCKWKQEAEKTIPGLEWEPNR